MMRIKTVDGCRSNGNQIWPERIVVRVTVDEHGKTLSLSNDRDVMLTVPMEGLEDLVRSGWEHRNEGQNLS